MALTLSGTNGVVGAGFTVDASGVSVTAGVGTFSSVQGSGASLTALPAANLTGTLPALTAANLTNIPAANIVGVCTSGLTKTGGFGKLLQIVNTHKYFFRCCWGINNWSNFIITNRSYGILNCKKY